MGISVDVPIGDPTVFTKNRDRQFQGNLLSAEHFTVGGTLLEALAGHKGVKPKDQSTPPTDPDPGDPTVDFRGDKGTMLDASDFSTG